ncbi:hypothetical protein IJJ27_00145 [bacterium]|nr:hypothetical protein [bacterium]
MTNEPMANNMTGSAPAVSVSPAVTVPTATNSLPPIPNEAASPTPNEMSEPVVESKKSWWQEIAWGWVLSALLVSVMLIMVTFWVTGQIRQRLAKEQVQLMLAQTQMVNSTPVSEDTATATASNSVQSWRQQQSSTRLDQSCQWLGTRELVAELDERAAEIENNYTFSLPDETAVQYWRDFWWWAGDDADERCLSLKDCRHVFSDDVPFVLAYERRRYQMRHSRHEKYDEFIPEVAEAEQLQADAEVDFGVAVDDLRTFLPASVYNGARQEVQLLEVAEAPQQPWTWHLQEVRTDTDSGEIVLIADSEASSECQLVDGPVHCSCPRASYYLVGRKNEDSDELQYVEEFVRVWGVSQPLTPEPSAPTLAPVPEIAAEIT